MEDRAQYINLDEGLGRVRGNKMIYKRMLGLFLKSEEFAAFDAAFDQQDYARAGEVAHGIKGMTGNLGLVKVFELSTQLMNTLRAGGVPDDATVAEFRDAVAKTREIIAQLETELA